MSLEPQIQCYDVVLLDNALLSILLNSAKFLDDDFVRDPS